ncbi:MAG: RNA polymerase sigma factor [Christensenellales bacterium]
MIKNAVGGSRRAFEMLMNGYVRIIYSYALARVGSHQDAQDILQETMLAIWRGIGSFKGESSFKTWLMGIARRKISDHFRSIYKTGGMPLSDMGDKLSADGGMSSLDEAVDIQNAVKKLNDSERELVFLVFTAQMTYAEASKTLEVPVGTVKSRMSRIKSKLKAQLEKG